MGRALEEKQRVTAAELVEPRNKSHLPSPPQQGTRKIQSASNYREGDSKQAARLAYCCHRLPKHPLALAHPAHTYQSRSAGQRSLGDSRTCTCQCSGSRFPRSGRALRHRGPAYLRAEGRWELSSEWDNCLMSQAGVRRPYRSRSASR